MYTAVAVGSRYERRTWTDHKLLKNNFYGLCGCLEALLMFICTDR